MRKTIKTYLSSIFLSFFALLFSVSGAFAATPQFNFTNGDLETLVVGNWTTNGGTTNWADPISASAGDRVAFDVFYHNGVDGTTATNTRIRISYPTSATTQIVTTGYVWADNAAQVSDTGTINVSSSQTIAFESSALWYPNQTLTNPTNISVTNNGSSVEVNIGSVAGGWSSEGHVVFYANISNSSSGGSQAPIVDAGNNKDIYETQSVTLDGSASDPQGDTITYSWNCDGGTLSSSTILTPIYFAPSVSSDTTYTCTLTATDGTHSSSDTVNILVRNSGGGSGGGGGSNGGGGGGSGSGTPMLNVTVSADPNNGGVPLSGVDLTATVYAEGISSYRNIIYKFDCENNNSWDLMVETSSRNYIAKDLCSYPTNGIYTAKVMVESAGYEATNQTTVYVGPYYYGSAYGISVDAGTNRDVAENQTITLNGYAVSQYGYPLTYYWSCNGGSLSSSTTLNPTFYTPNVNADTTYACTLYASDNRGYKNSDTISITVRDKNYTGLAATTNLAENVSGTSANLKGTLSNNGGLSTSVRFNWGRLSSYSNYTPWISGKTSGQTVSQYISGLEKAKAYHYRIEASNGKDTVIGQDVTFVTKPDATTGFTALTGSTGQINLSWNPGASSCYTMVTRKRGAYPANSSDGTVVYYGTGNSFVDSGLNSGYWYYYRAWAVGCDEGLYSFADSQYAKAYTTGSGYVAPVVETGISLDALAKDATQNEIAWQDNITASPDDEIEFKIIITPTGGKSLEDVVLKANLSDKIGSISDIKVDEQSYSGSLTELKLGTIALGESKTITFKGKIASKDSFSYGSNELISSIEVSAKNVALSTKTITIVVSRMVEAGAGLISFFDLKFYAGALTVLFIILCLIMMYLLIERKKGRECLVEKEGETKVEKSKYFNIK